jgi:hypothetical protein
MREESLSYFGIPTQFSPQWAAGMAMPNPSRRPV